jgi:UDP-glucose 4-epimerase
MQILNPCSGDDASGPLVLIFGLGMIGGAISRSLLSLGYEVRGDIAWDWNDAARRVEAQELIAAHCRTIAPVNGSLAVAWSAGNATFHSTAGEVKHELEVFMETIGFIKSLREALHAERFAFHFVSSAGGLFEGQRVVGIDSRPAPQRPYGELKLAQETELLDHFGASELAFYRPSSVYGPMRQNARKGLINNLVNNGRKARTTVLDAHVMSLRDYVFSHDVGHFVARCIRSDATGEGQRPERFLVSSRCSSIFEVVRKIERILNLHLRVRYDENFGNSRNITFSQRVMPVGWRPVTLDVGLRQFLVGAS